MTDHQCLLNNQDCPCHTFTTRKQYDIPEMKDTGTLDNEGRKIKRSKPKWPERLNHLKEEAERLRKNM